MIYARSLLAPHSCRKQLRDLAQQKLLERLRHCGQAFALAVCRIPVAQDRKESTSRMALFPVAATQAEFGFSPFDAAIHLGFRRFLQRAQ